ncbi:methyl-accepting chemotaxis protein [Dechloromonas sp. XY25]|uniref:Methyl-accepting chemotaxis protein n=1 Tax=Dechloromonas hankyongensis TaxID=2908002 RepID=A0ABS9K187_9RHOO|nr:PAS domain-containing methyl-accepting chemotaxis protein [Dechloromonas hankyongensis]MCG2576949.1 methyl-accepting chemotaxis protein [Dechloromonas hankyongensis]
MKNNQPVNHVETLLPENEFIYSRTDLKGIIVEANEAFAKVSGFLREEMIGQPHNLVRHPDMPEAAFADLWSDLKAGRPWRGIVKNRRKDGGFYWVVANASPVRENGQIVGYQSVRSRPTRDEVKAAEAAYKRIREGDRSIFIQFGRVVKRCSPWLNALLSLRAQMAIMGLALLFECAFVLYGRMATSSASTIDNLHAVIAGIGLLYGLYFLFVFTPRVNSDLSRLGEWLESLLLSGALNKRFDLARRDVIGTIARRADKFVSTVQATVQGMADIASQVNQATGMVGQGVEVARQSATQQSEASSSAAAAIEEVTVSIGEVAEHAHCAQAVAQKAGQLSHEGAALSSKATATILALADTVKKSATQVETLGDRSAEISRIVGVIKEIADQTNLLALNAAIEAARAGEQGRGFAVVADEVRKLAERTGSATQEIGTMISAIQSDTQHAVEGMRSGAIQVEAGVELVQEAEQALLEINTEMSNTNQMVSDISHASAEQENALIQLAQNVEKVADMTEQNVAVVTQTESLVRDLTLVADRMRKSVHQFAV